MKLALTLFALFILAISKQSLSQGIILLPSGGIQLVTTNISGDSPVLKAGKQDRATAVFSFRAHQNTRAGFFVGFSTANLGLYVVIQKKPDIEMGNWVPSARVEVGYQWTSKQIRIVKEADSQETVSLEFQPLVGIGYNLEPRAFYGSTETTSSGVYRLITNKSIHGTVSILTGTNIYVWSGKKRIFFLSIMRNSNFKKTQTAVLYTQINNATFTQALSTRGTGFHLTIGAPIRIGGRKK